RGAPSPPSRPQSRCSSVSCVGRLDDRGEYNRRPLRCRLSIAPLETRQPTLSEASSTGNVLLLDVVRGPCDRDDVPQVELLHRYSSLRRLGKMGTAPPFRTDRQNRVESLGAPILARHTPTAWPLATWVARWAADKGLWSTAACAASAASSS